MKWMIFIALVGFASCKSEVKQRTPSEFGAFFEKFSNDSVFQRRHVSFPIIVFRSDEDFPLDLLEESIDETDYMFIDFRKDDLAKTLPINPYEVNIEPASDTVFYRQTGIGNSWNMTYLFVKSGKTWNLIEIRDLTD